MALFKRRRELEQMAAAEARGESFWTTEFERPVRVKVLRAFRRAAYGDQEYALETARELLLDDLGWTALSGDVRPVSDVLTFVEHCDDEMFASAVEALGVGLFSSRQDFQRHSSADVTEFIDATNRIFGEHRVSYKNVDGRMVPFDSEEMHGAVVEPTLRLLASRSGWHEVERAYQDALTELGKGDSDDAITDAVRALESALDVRGFGGNSLGARVAAAKDADVISSADKKLYEWVAASRGNLSDAHPGSTATGGDAWLAVHVVGALILRLAD